jgi:nucleotide-binding universal stress UspA family protein
MTFHKILCPVDFSAGSLHAMQLAVRIATASDAELVLSHAWHLPAVAYGGEYPVAPEAIQTLIDDDERGLLEAARDAAALGAKRVKTAFTSGMPWEQITEMLRADPAFDLVVMGTHGRTGVGRILLGSVTERVVRHSPCSVLAVRDGAAAKPFGHVLCPIDFSESSRHAVELAASLVAPGGAGITLLHVVEVPVSYSGEPPVAGFVDDLDRQGSRLLEQWATELRAKVSVPVTARSRIGSPGVQTLAVLDETPSFDLVVTGSHGRTGLRRVLLGSVAEKILRHAPCPVLVARTRTA